MSLTSPYFILGVAVLLILYYLMPRKAQWPLLLCASLLFYLCGGIGSMAFLAVTTASTWLAGLALGALNARRRDLSPEEKAAGQALIKRRKKLVVLAACLINFGILFLLKYWSGTASVLSRLTGKSVGVRELLLPLGLSFFTFQAIGYVIDVYRDKYEPQHSIAKYALFVSFFPQMIQGPVSRYDHLAPQLMESRALDWENLRAGIKLAMWGYMKKLVIAERASVVANAVFSKYWDYPGSVLAFGVLAYSLQLYCDFSGGIDVTRAVARMLGIDLAENFRRPVFARSLTEFWRRWHITLGAWMRDYLFYPLSLSKPFARLGRWARQHIPGKAGKIFATSLATFTVYLAIGVWHGSSLKYIAYGFYNGGIITASLLLEGVFVRWRAGLGMGEESKGWNLFRILRTNAIVFVGRYITRAPRLMVGLSMLRRTVTNFNPGALINGMLSGLGLDIWDYSIAIAAALLMLAVELRQELGRESRLPQRHWAAQWALMLLSLLGLLFFGLGGSYTPAPFIYAQF